MDAREKEEYLLAKCLLVGSLVPAKFDAIEANLFIVAAKLIGRTFPLQSSHLRLAGISFLNQGGHVPMQCEELIHAGLIASLPRFRYMLEHQFRKNNHAI